MQEAIRRVLLAAMTSTTACLLLLGFGCEKENPVDDGEGISETNLLPMAQGRLWVFTTYSLDTTDSQKIQSTVHRDVSYIQGTASVGGKSALRMIDSIYTPAGTLESADTTYFALEGRDLWMWDEDMPTPAWGPVFKLSAGLNTEYTILQWQEVHDGFPVSITLKGKIYPKETVSVPAATLQAYKIELKATVTFGGASIDQVMQYFYLADGYGPIRITTPVQTDPGSGRRVEGEESLLVSKNF